MALECSIEIKLCMHAIKVLDAAGGKLLQPVKQMLLVCHLVRFNQPDEHIYALRLLLAGCLQHGTGFVCTCAGIKKYFQLASAGLAQV